MIVLLAAGIGVCILGLLAFGFGIPISDTSFGNALLIAGVVVFCTGLILVGMWLVARELVGLTRLVLAQGTQPARPPVPSRPINPFAAPAAEQPGGGAAPPLPPWADEAAARAKAPPPVPDDVQPAEPPAPPPPPPAPDRPARRNLLFASKRRDKDESAANPPLPPPPLEAEPKVSFEDAWPNPSRSNGAAERQEPATAVADEPAPADQTKSDLPPGVTVVKSGVVDGMAYTLYSDG